MTLPAGTLPLRAPDDVFADVLRYEFGIDAEHCLLGNMPYKIPPDQKLYVVVFDDMGPVVGTATVLDTDSASPTYLKELQQSRMLHYIRAEVAGFIDDQGFDVAKATAAMIPGALNGFYSQQLQGKYKMQFGQAQQPINASDAEETRRLVRYMVRSNATVLHQVARTPPDGGYYDKFNGATTDGTVLPPAITTQ